MEIIVVTMTGCHSHHSEQGGKWETASDRKSTRSTTAPRTIRELIRTINYPPGLGTLQKHLLASISDRLPITNDDCYLK